MPSGSSCSIVATTVPSPSCTVICFVAALAVGIIPQNRLKIMATVSSQLRDFRSFRFMFSRSFQIRMGPPARRRGGAAHTPQGPLTPLLEFQPTESCSALSRLQPICSTRRSNWAWRSSLLTCHRRITRRGSAPRPARLFPAAVSMCSPPFGLHLFTKNKFCHKFLQNNQTAAYKY